MNEPIGFIGLGGMGTPMAGNLLKAGFSLRVYNRTAERARPLVEQGAVQAENPVDAVSPGGVVLTMLTDDAAVESVASAFLPWLGPGGVHLSLSTISPATARRLAETHRAVGAHYVGSPVFGKPEVAAQKKLWICSSGNPQARARVRPLQEAMGQKVYDFGDDPGAAHVVKLCGNFLIGSAVEAMAEAFTLAQKNGIERQQVYELFATTLFDCFVFRGYGQLVAGETYQPVGAKPSLIRKDYRLILQAAAEAQTPMPLASLIHDRLTATVAKGRDELDWSSFAREVSEAAGLCGCVSPPGAVGE